jgi:hypothetical protein
LDWWLSADARPSSILANSQCTLMNNKGTWYTTTPNSVAVHRSYDDLNVKCAHDGYIAKASSAPSSTKGLAFGNILFGGLIGTAIDMGTGAAYDYPGTLIMDLQPAKSAQVNGAPMS